VKTFFATTLLILSSFSVFAEEQLIELSDGTELPVKTFTSEGDALFIWLPSEFGLSPRFQQLAQRNTKVGIETWIPDYHSAWFIPPGRYSLNELDPQFVVEVIDKALSDTTKDIYLVNSGRMAVKALQATRRLQDGQRDLTRLRGMISISPRLYQSTPQGGETAVFLPIASASNLPIYILQPKAAGGYWRVGLVAEELEKGGSPVFLQTLEDVGDGFFSREFFSDLEAKMTQRLPNILKAATQQLKLLDGTPNTASRMSDEEAQPEKPSGSALLKPYKGDAYALPLKLNTLEGRSIDLAELKGQVVLVNFWATWCPPCVEEIPSLERLYQKTKPRGLEILAVDVGETKEQMREFLKDKPITFPVLMDIDGSALKRWNVHAFPTTLILDRQHKIRYAGFGAFNWSGTEVLKTLEPLLQD